MNLNWFSLAILAAFVFMPFDAAAHAFGSRYDLPLPLTFFLFAAGIAVAASFVGAFFIPAPGSRRAFHADLSLPGWLAKITAASLGTLGLLIFATVLITAASGPASPTKNFATVFVWVLWWVGFVLFSALVVNVWHWVNPFRILAALVGRSHKRAVNLPDGAAWMAPLGLLFISWLELCSEMSEDPGAMLWLIMTYLLITLAGALVFGADAWMQKCDPLARLFTLVGAIAPMALDREKAVFSLRLPASALVEKRAQLPGAELFILILVAVVMFDGLSETPLWQSVLEFVTRSKGLRPWLLDLQAAGIDILQFLQTLGLLALVLFTFICYRLLSTLMWLPAGGGGGDSGRIGDIARRFVTSILPIAIAYHLAHYVSYLVLAGQLILPIINDPFSLGWDLFGLGAYRLDLGLINAEDVWWVAISAVISGHILSVLVAHAQAMEYFKSRRRAILSQLPMAVFMVALSMSSLWVLSQPIVQ